MKDWGHGLNKGTEKFSIFNVHN